MTPRWYQSEAVDAVWQHMRASTGSPLVVLPTGAGKSLVIAMLAQQARKWDGRTLVLAHRKELLRQNAAKIQALLPDEKIGIYSAGLSQRDTEADIICGGIQSVYNKAGEFGRRELVIIDESHLIPPDGDGMYQQYLRELQFICPNIRPIGLTATPYRCSSGPLAGKGRMFERICYEVQTGQLINEGFLCPLTNKPAQHQTDTTAIKVRGGEFVTSSMAAVFGHTDEILIACQEIIDKTKDRKSILVFCSGVEHAEQVARVLEECTNQECGTVTGETGPLEREATLRRFSSGELRWLTNCDVLTTGFDNPRIDCVAVLRATMSPGLFAQIVGRGLRLHPTKSNCLVLDFGGNIERHGPLDDPNYGRADFRSTGGSAEERNGRGKLCPNCETDVPAAARECQECGFLFPDPRPSHGTEADDENALLNAEPQVYTVQAVRAVEHEKKNNPDAPTTLRVIYTVVPADAEAAEPMTEEEAEAYFEWNKPTPAQCGCGHLATIPTVKHEDGKYQASLVCGHCGQWVKRLQHPNNIPGEAGNLEEKEVSEWVCFNHEGYARQKAEAWWQERSTAAIPLSVDDALICWESIIQPRRITVTKEGRWDRIIGYEFDEEPPEEWAPCLAGVDMEDDEIPF
jgi:DNA repair protein RadD